MSPLKIHYFSRTMASTSEPQLHIYSPVLRLFQVFSKTKRNFCDRACQKQYLELTQQRQRTITSDPPESPPGTVLFSKKSLAPQSSSGPGGGRWTEKVHLRECTFWSAPPLKSPLQAGTWNFLQAGATYWGFLPLSHMATWFLFCVCLGRGGHWAS